MINKFIKIRKEIKELDKNLIKAIFFELLQEAKIDFIDLSISYTTYLESEQNKNKRKQNLMAGCIATKCQSIKEEYNEARASVLIKDYVPEGFIKKYFKGVSKKEIKKQREFVENEINNPVHKWGK